MSASKAANNISLDGTVIGFTGLSGAGKTTIAVALKNKLEARSQAVNIRQNVELKLNSTDANTETVLSWRSKITKVTLENGSATSIVFEPTGSIKDFNTATMTFSICHSDLGVSKRLQLTRMGTITTLAEGVC